MADQQFGFPGVGARQQVVDVIGGHTVQHHEVAGGAGDPRGRERDCRRLCSWTLTAGAPVRTAVFASMSAAVSSIGSGRSSR